MTPTFPRSGVSGHAGAIHTLLTSLLVGYPELGYT
jgi:hypothetical protein